MCVWNASTRGQWFQAACLRGHAYAVNSLAFSPCGLVLATGGNEDGVRLWDMGAILHRSEAQRADNGYGLAGPGPSGPQVAAITIRGDEAASSGRHPAPGRRGREAGLGGEVEAEAEAEAGEERKAWGVK